MRVDHHNVPLLVTLAMRLLQFETGLCQNILIQLLSSSMLNKYINFWRMKKVSSNYTYCLKNGLRFILVPEVAGRIIYSGPALLQ